MDEPAAAMERLAAAIAAVRRAWPSMRWRRVSGPGPAAVTLRDQRFPGLVLEPGTTLVLRCDLAMPETVAGAVTAGDALEVTVDSLCPLTLRCDGRPVLDDDGAPAAPSPAMVTVREGGGARHPLHLELTLRAPGHRAFPSWLKVAFTTPAIRRRLERLDLAWARLALCEAVAGPGDGPALAAASRLVPEQPLELEEAALAAALDASGGALAPFTERVAALQVHLVGHAHLDLAWLWPAADGSEVVLRDVRSALDLMDEFPELTYTCSQAAAYRVLGERAPDLVARMRAHVSSGRWEAATMAWVEGDTNLVGGESLVRQLLEGVRCTREVAGIAPETLLAPDTFGHSANLPQLAVSAGARQYVHLRCNPSGLDHLPAYIWRGLDGTELLAISCAYRGDVEAARVARAMRRALRHGQPAAVVFHGVGDHGGGPTRADMDRLRRLRAEPLLPRLVTGTVARFAAELRRAPAAPPMHAGELPAIYEGSYSSVSLVKRLNRLGETALATAETVSALAGEDARPALRRAWRAVLDAQAHDVIAGTAIEAVYDDCRRQVGRAVTAARRVTEAALPALRGTVSEPAVVVVNPLGWEREDLVEVALPPGSPARRAWLVDRDGRPTPAQAAGRRLCFVARVPGFGTAEYRLPAGTAAPPACPPLRARPERAPVLDELAPGGRAEGEPPYLVVETERLVAWVRRDSGILASLVNRASSRDLVGHGMARPSDTRDSSRADLGINVLQLIREMPHFQSAWYLSDVAEEVSLLGGASCRVAEAGPVRLVLEVRHRAGGSSIVQRITFHRTLGRIDVRLLVDWRERGGDRQGVPGLKVACTLRSAASEAWFGLPFGAAHRPAAGAETCGLRWAAIDGEGVGLALMNSGVAGYDALGPRLRLTLLRSTYGPAPEPELGRHAIDYAIHPYAGGWREAGVQRLAMEHDQPLIARWRQPGPLRATGPGWRPSVEPGSVVVSCFRRREAGEGFVLRLLESVGRETAARVWGLPPGAAVLESDVLETPGPPLPAGGDLALRLRPWQVRTLLIVPPG